MKLLREIQYKGQLVGPQMQIFSNVQQFIIQSQMKVFILALLFTITLSQLIAANQLQAELTDIIVKPCIDPNFNCSLVSGAFFNSTICGCQCNAACDCKNPLQQWANYPTCQCVCKTQVKCNTEIQYWYSPTCSCKCKYPLACKLPYVWNESVCKCTCGIECALGYYLVPGTCICKKSPCPLPYDCPSSKSYNPQICRCV